MNYDVYQYDAYRNQYNLIARVQASSGRLACAKAKLDHAICGGLYYCRGWRVKPAPTFPADMAWCLVSA